MSVHTFKKSENYIIIWRGVGNFNGNINLLGGGQTASISIKTTALRLFYAPHVTKRPTKCSALVEYILYKPFGLGRFATYQSLPKAAKQPLFVCVRR